MIFERISKTIFSSQYLEMVFFENVLQLRISTLTIISFRAPSKPLKRTLSRHFTRPLTRPLTRTFESESDSLILYL